MFSKFVKDLKNGRKRKSVKSTKAESHTPNDAIIGDGLHNSQINKLHNDICHTENCVLEKCAKEDVLSPVKSESFDTQNAETVSSSINTTTEPEIISSWMVDLKGADQKISLSVQSPNGYDRGQVLDDIIGATDDTGELCFVVKWANSNDVELVAAAIVNTKNPQEVISFYEKHLILLEFQQGPEFVVNNMN